MVGSPLGGEIEGIVEATVACRRDQAAEILDRAELGVQSIVAAFGTSSRVRAADVMRPDGLAVVAPLAVSRANRMDRREIEDIEAHVANAWQTLNHVGEGAMPSGGVGLGAWEQLVPACEGRFR